MADKKSKEHPMKARHRATQERLAAEEEVRQEQAEEAEARLDAALERENS